MTERTRILLVEDEETIRGPLTALLEREGYATEGVATAHAARRALTQRAPDLVLLDWMLPDAQGIDLLREWRAEGVGVPVIFLTARVELVDRVLGLEMGADDYVTKPFEPRELVARIRARLRTTARAAPPPERLAFAGLEMDLDSRRVTYRGRELELARLEFGLLELLLRHPSKVFTRDELLNRVWGYEAFPTTRTVDTHVLQLRKKTHPELFESIRGVGYRLRDRGGADEK